ncbi:hypothetical protein GCM10009745_59520 [Kribbella yunnanensis]|uniref:HEAT repeat domain-containing protein n=1 Tax=Kribbella yunnanensis TaxID=190194 RepID=A0ABN2IFJ1_9ACTN
MSRWESGRLAVSHATLDAYERVLELPAGSLTACVDVIRRYWSPQVAAPTSAYRREGADAVLDDLLDRIAVDGPLTATEWDLLTERIVRVPGLYLRQRDWTSLADRLLRELLVADRGLYLRRREAFHRLLAHPQAQAAAIGAAVSAGADTTGQGIIEAVSMLDGSAHPDAAAAVVRQLDHPTTSSAQIGALQAAVRKVRFGHFSPAQLARVSEMAGEMIRSGRDDDELVALADELKVGQMPASSGSSRPGVLLGRLVLGITGAAGLPESLDDQVLPLLIEELMFSPSADARLLASSLVAASPFRPTAARAVAAELTSARVLIDQADWAEKLLDTLRLIGGQDQVELVQRVATADGIPSSVNRAAAITIGHVGGKIDRSFWSRGFGKYVVRWRRHHRPADAQQLDALVYSAGVLGERSILTTLRADPTLPAKARTAAAWWINLPTHVADGART